MSSRNINNYETIDGDLIISEINNKILATDVDGLVYGLENNSGKFLKDIDGSGTYEFTQPTLSDIDFNLNPNIVVVTDTDGDLTNSTISTTKLTYLYNVSSDIQTQIDSKQSTLSATNRLSPSFISPGTIDSTEFGYLNGVTSNIQTQFSGKQPLISGTLDISRSDNASSSLEMGNDTYATNTFIDFHDPTYTDYGLRIIRNPTNQTNFLHRGSSNWVFNSQDGGNFYIQQSGVTKLLITTTNIDFYNTVTFNTKLDATNIGTGIVSNTEFNYLDGVTSAIQTQLNGKQSLLSDVNTLDPEYIGSGNITSAMFETLKDNTWNINNTFISVTGDIDNLTDNKQNLLSASNRLDAAFIGGGLVSTTEYDYLNGVTSNIQTQLNAKQSIMWSFSAGSGTNINILSPSVSSSLNIVRTDNNTSHIEMGNSTFAQSNYIDIQDPTYIDYGFRLIRNAALSTSFLHRSTSNWVFNSQDLGPMQFQQAGSNMMTITSTATNFYNTVTFNTKLDATNIGTGVVSNTEFNYLDGVTSSIQTQINTKQPTYFTLSGTNILPAATTYNYNLVRNDSSENYFKIGNTNSSILNNTYLDIVDYTNGAYGMRISKQSFAYGNCLGTFENKGGKLQFTSDDDISIIHGSTNKIIVKSASVEIPNTTTATSSTTMKVQFNNLSILQTGHQFIAFQNSGGTIGSIRGTGSSSTIAYATTSDRRIKENIIISNGSEHYDIIKNNNNQTCQYNYINDDDDNIQIGFIAQDIREIFPACVQGNDTDLEEYGQPLTVDYSRVTPLLYSALKQSITEIESLKTKILDLQYQIDILKNAINELINL